MSDQNPTRVITTTTMVTQVWEGVEKGWVARDTKTVESVVGDMAPEQTRASRPAGDLVDAFDFFPADERENISAPTLKWNKDQDADLWRIVNTPMTEGFTARIIRFSTGYWINVNGATRTKPFSSFKKAKAEVQRQFAATRGL